MKVIMFQPQFVPLIQDSNKRSTIRPIGKRPPVAGEQRSLRYWSGRPYASKQVEIAAVTLTSVQPITITETGISIDGQEFNSILFMIARMDGFPDWPAMRRWFKNTHGLPFSGLLIRW